MSNLPVNKKTFNITNRISKTFSLVVDGFQYATSLFFRVRFKIPIVFSGTALTKIIQTINLRKIKLVISQMKLIAKITQVINLRRVRLIISYKEKGKLVTTIFGRVRITPVSRAIQKASSLINLRRVRIIADPTLAEFFTLGDFDPDTLGTLDVLTLGDMDYTIA